MADVSGQLNLDVGLEQVTFQRDAKTSSGQFSLGCVAPDNPQFELLLEEVLYVPVSQEERLLRSLRPQITHRELLQPQAYQAMVDDALDTLKKRAKKMVPSEDRNKIQKAVRTLQKFKALSGQLRSYQYALRQG